VVGVGDGWCRGEMVGVGGGVGWWERLGCPRIWGGWRTEGREGWVVKVREMLGGGEVDGWCKGGLVGGRRGRWWRGDWLGKRWFVGRDNC
jgi:hypothetical protein